MLPPPRPPTTRSNRTSSRQGSRPSNAGSSSRSSRQPSRTPSRTMPSIPEGALLTGTEESPMPITAPESVSGRASRASNRSLGSVEPPTVICAISEGRSISPIVGVAFINMSLGEVILCEMCDNQTYVKTTQKLQVMGASRAIFMSKLCPPLGYSLLYSAVERNVPGIGIDRCDKSDWSVQDGVEFVEKYAFTEDVAPLKVAIENKPYAISSFSTAVKYIERQFRANFTENSLRVRYQPSSDTMMIDISLFSTLEIMQNARDAKSKDCLFGLLNQTSTPMGARMLRNSMLQPSTDRTALFARYDAVEEMSKNEDMYSDIRTALKGIRDIEKILTKITVIPTDQDASSIENQVNQVLLIKSFVVAIPKLTQALLPAQSDLLVKARTVAAEPEARRVLALIDEVLEADITYMSSPLDLRNQRMFAVKKGTNSLLDLNRAEYKELTERVHQHVAEINDQYGVAATLKYDNGRKYYLVIKTSKVDNDTLPTIFIYDIRKRYHFECQTLDLAKLNRRITDSVRNSMMESDNVIWSLVGDLRHEVACLYHMAESVAIVDMIASFARMATTYNYVRPDIGPTLALCKARHPILDKKPATYVPNSYISTALKCFHIITGCNMSGKSTYIRSVALLQVMAQIGSFVPAEYACFSPVDSMFARLSLNDRIEANLSTFAVEMRDMAFIFQNIDNRSMAIIDELGRGTSTLEGLAIAVAMAEALCRTGASVWFATHFVELARALEGRVGVINMHLAATHTTTAQGLPHIRMLYKAEEGAMKDTSHYGIHLARAIGLPKSLCDTAEWIADDIRTKREAKNRKSETRIAMARRTLMTTLYSQLVMAYESGSDEALPEYLRRLQREFVIAMTQVDAGEDV